MADPITPAVSDRICKHMNEDHADALLLYALVYGRVATAEAARLEAIDPKGINLIVYTAGVEIPVRLNFKRELQDSEDAHQTLIEMVKEARKISNKEEE